VQDVAHRAQPNHQQAKVGVRLQALIFSQQEMKVLVLADRACRSELLWKELICKILKEKMGG
jgi:hypothetical protein